MRRFHMITTAFITGADKGLGFSLVRRFLRAGVRVFAGLRTPEINQPGRPDFFPEPSPPFPRDVTQMDSVIEAAAGVGELTPALDALINNAGVMLKPPTPLSELDLTRLPLVETMEVN